MQGLYNMIYREEEREMIPYCKATGVGLLPWSPLAAGVLTHPWADRTDQRETSDIFLKALFRGNEVEADKAIVSRVEALAKRKGVSMAQVATSWIVSRGGMAPICGLETKERIDQAVEALEVILTKDECRYLEELYVPKSITGY